MQPVAVQLVPMALIDIDASYFIILGLLLLLIAVLKPLVFNPMLLSITARSAKTDEARREARALAGRAEDIAARYEAELATTRGRAAAVKAELRAAGVAQRDAVVTAARASASQEQERVRQSVDQQVAGARGQVLAQVDDLGRQIAEKILGRGL